VAALGGIKVVVDHRGNVVLSIVIKITVKEVDINSEVLYIDVVIVIIIKVGSTLALVITPCYTRFCTTRFYTTRFRITSKAIDKGIVVPFIIFVGKVLILT
jgi:membrane protein YdbS with pleckstrin-like domain